jgi:integrase
MINGVRYTATLPTREDAEDWETLLRAKAVSGSLPRRISVSDYAARWMSTYDTAPTPTRNFHQGNLDRYILSVLGPRSVADVTPTEISRLVNGVSARVSAATADAVYRTCSALFNAAVADDVMVRSPVKSKRHRPRRQREAHVVLERLEARHLLLHLKGWHRDTALLQLALGARVGEIGGLTPHDIDLRRRRVTVRRRHYRGTIRATKNHRMRTLELPAITIPTLERLIDAAGAVSQIPPLDDREHDADQFLKYWLIQTSTGRPVNYSAYNKALAKACASACCQPRCLSLVTSRSVSLCSHGPWSESALSAPRRSVGEQCQRGPLLTAENSCLPVSPGPRGDRAGRRGSNRDRPDGRRDG